MNRLAAEGMRFVDYYAEASCTAGRANFITGQLPIRTGLTSVGQAGSPLGMPDEAPTIATALRAMGYATGQFGKNHLGDLNRFPPVEAQRDLLSRRNEPRRGADRWTTSAGSSTSQTDGSAAPSRSTGRLDPFERTGIATSLAYYNWFVYEFWRFVFVKQEVAKYAQTFLEFPPMQKGASFNLERLKEELEKKLEARPGH